MRRARSLRVAQGLLVGVLAMVLLLTSACGGDSHLQQQANSARTQLDQQIKHAESIGVPVSSLQTILDQEQALNKSSAPFSMFDDTPVNTFYKNQTSSYQQLLSKLQEQVAIVTGQYQGKAQQDLQSFNDALTTQQAQKVGDIQAFSLRYTTDENLLAAAQYPKDYQAISYDARNATDALDLMGSTYKQLTIFQNTIKQMQKANLDVTAMQSQYSSDLNSFNSATSTGEFQSLTTLLNAQYQLAVVNSIQSLPYVGAAKLASFQNQIDQLKLYGMDSSAYVKMYNKDKTAMAQASTISDYLKVSKQIDTDMAAMQPDLIQGESWYLITKLDKEAKAWGKQHLYHDKTDGKNYIPDSGYTMDGIGYWLQRENGWSYTTADYQSVVNDDVNEFFNFEMFKQDYADKTPYNQVHQTDLELMQHYPSLKSGAVIMVSMAQQSLHFFVNGKLVKAFQITTGRVERPTLPGVWFTQDRKSPTEFKSSDPPSSPFYYPPTPIHYAILYHWGGFFVHDSWWRNDYGPGTQYPHNDSSGNSSSMNGSHGCVNVREDQAAWLYAHTDWNTQIVIY
ncbi:MAG TPA: L,D-transpeptidase [Ktedonobacteraceae bacterium]|nr:L,D-transpeptidase [Ktedonobacteraceae bacterium]